MPPQQATFSLRSSRSSGLAGVVLGAESSQAFVRAPEGNGCAKPLVRKLKGHLLWTQTFDAIEELRQALIVFEDTYNTTWLIRRLGHRTPVAVRRELLSPSASAG